MSASVFSPERGLGVIDGVGKPFDNDASDSGVRESGRKLSVDGRGRAGDGFVTATEGMDAGTSGDSGGGVCSWKGSGCFSSSSSSSSTKVCN